MFLTEYFPWMGIIFALVLMVLIALKVYTVVTMGVCQSQNRLDGKIVIITGGSAGIGRETALDLAGRGARVILACRNLNKSFRVRDDIISATNNPNVEVRELDLSSLQSVRSFASGILKSEAKLDVLINNAGCAGASKKLTEDGLEYQMQTNHFGHFLLTNLLLGVLLTTENSRIINVSSSYHTTCKKLDMSNINFTREKTGEGILEIYAASKVCNILFTRQLAKKLKSMGGSVTVNALHPGAIRTEILNTFGLWMRLGLFMSSFFMKTAKQGAQTTIDLAVNDQWANVTGEFFSDCKISKMSKVAQGDALATKLWDVSEELVNLSPEEKSLNPE